MMTGRGQNNGEWDVDDFNNSSYAPQYPDDNASGGVRLDHCRLYIRNIPKALNDEGLRTAFSKYGTLCEVYLNKDSNNKYALVRYETPGEAKLAMTKLNNTEPLGLCITIAHKHQPKSNRRDEREPRDNTERNNGPHREPAHRNNREREDVASLSSRSSRRGVEDMANGEDLEDSLPALDDDIVDPDIKMKGIQLELQRLQVQEQSMLLRKQLLQLEAAKKRNQFSHSTTPSNRCVLPDGRVVVRNVHDRSMESRDGDGSFAAGAGDSNERKPLCSCVEAKSQWDQQTSSEGSSTSTCVLCSEDHMYPVKSVTSKYTDSKDSSRFDKTELSRKSVASKTIVKSEYSNTEMKSDVTSKKLDLTKKKSDMTSDWKYSDFYSDSDDETDETNRLIQLRNSDYMDIVGDDFKVIIALAGYPKSKMRLRQLEFFQRCLNDVIEMQLKNGLLKRVPSFLDYYLNRGAIVCICKDLDTRNWVVRVSPGLQERMELNLILLKSRVKRLCLAVMKIPDTCWPTTAKDAFKLLQYFNPTLKTHLWKIYSQKMVGNVETTSFLIDRVSGEIIRGQTFKNVIDYNQMEFELTGYTDIYYQCLLSDLDEDLHSVASRVKLLEELKSDNDTPRTASTINVEKENKSEKEVPKEINTEKDDDENKASENIDSDDIIAEEPSDMKKDFEDTLQKEVLNKLKDVEYISGDCEVIVWSEEMNTYNSDQESDRQSQSDKENKSYGPSQTDAINEEEIIIENAGTSMIAETDKTESIADSNDNLIATGSNLNIDSNRGIAYHRRTNYLHVENELKVAIALDGYPQNKLDGTHIRRLKRLFREYLHKDMKMQRFTNLIIPKFQDVYLANGAVIYICDSLETKDYLTEKLPKFRATTGLKLNFKDIKELVRYTRVVLSLPKKLAHVESLEILLKLQAVYPGLKPDCWKYYSNVVGKQKRQFGVDPESLEVIKSPDFDPTYEGEKLEFRIIDRQKRDVSYEGSNDKQSNEANINKDIKDKLMKLMYAPVDPEITNIPLTRIRMNHYSDLLDDDLKLYVGPTNYPEMRIDENLFHSIKRAFESVVYEEFMKGDSNEDAIPKFHDMYLFDGVIFVICCNKVSREWMENSIKTVNVKLQMNLKSTEFRGAVGIVSMVLKTTKDTDDVIATLQKQNPRLRSKYWRKISTVKTKTKLDVVLQIDKLSAQVISSPEFDNNIDGNTVEFKLGHLQSLLNPKFTLEELTKKHSKKIDKIPDKTQDTYTSKEKTIEELRSDINKKYPDLKIDQWDVITSKGDTKVIDLLHTTSNNPLETDSEQYSPVASNSSDKKVYLRIPLRLAPEKKEDLAILFDLLEDQNPGLNTELWKVHSSSSYSNNRRYRLLVDRRSAAIIKGKKFNPIIGGERLTFMF